MQNEGAQRIWADSAKNRCAYREKTKNEAEFYPPATQKRSRDASLLWPIGTRDAQQKTKARDVSTPRSLAKTAER